VNTNREIDDWAECARDASRAIDAAGSSVPDAATLGTAARTSFCGWRCMGVLVAGHHAYRRPQGRHRIP
jgi:hypothetical protein